MANQETRPIKFTCYNCGNISRYPHEMVKGEADAGPKILIKRCTTCGAENRVELPNGWIAQRPDDVLRGYK